MKPLEERLRKQIAGQGPIAVHDYMAEANAHYYATRDPLGAAGDFVTAPEISQMFGELAGIWLADVWQRAGRPEGAHYVELGPGRGTLAADALRAMRGAGLDPPVELIETSPLLRGAQAARLAARWHDDLSTLPESGPLLVVANEFFDALPVRQFDAEGRELRIELNGDRFVRDGHALTEASPASLEIVHALARRLVAQGGAALIVDYGHDRPGTGDTLQAVSRHSYADPFEAPGERDLTAHVDFAALAGAARDEGARAFGPVTQGDWLDAMGLPLRAAALAKAAPERADEIAEACDRLAAPRRMGTMFKMLALAAPSWPIPGGFEMGVSYRLANRTDGPALAAMGRRCFSETFGAHYDAADLDRHLDRAFGPGGLPAELADPAIRVMVAEDAGAVAAYLKLAPMGLPVEHPAGALEIKQLYVLQPWQGAGVAPVLIDWAIGAARDEGAPALFLSVWAHNGRAIAFYRRYGFEMAGHAPFTVGERIDLDPVMRLDL